MCTVQEIGRLPAIKYIIYAYMNIIPRGIFFFFSWEIMVLRTRELVPIVTHPGPLLLHGLTGIKAWTNRKSNFQLEMLRLHIHDQI